MTRRQRSDLALLLIVRRAERDAGVLSRSRSEGPDVLTVIDQGCCADEAESQHPSRARPTGYSAGT
jgi:hypothetical protein